MHSLCELNFTPLKNIKRTWTVSSSVVENWERFYHEVEWLVNQNCLQIRKTAWKEGWDLVRIRTWLFRMSVESFNTENVHNKAVKLCGVVCKWTKGLGTWWMFWLRLVSKTTLFVLDYSSSDGPMVPGNTCACIALVWRLVVVSEWCCERLVVVA